ncbi:hypothetical protein [Clostridium beijerinckii]|uniref:Uncharacterized protein n=1 Tax=Clostridium beijerinckii TaxID=1520 RepID=A0AAE5H6T4_CLOBE|nr:hypothetical protein [Clostridium beijerinckii]NSB15433.1 hypothetical protein [Clostridium beijerinckii]OOM20517.1 hypothetical protein CLOBE_49400 [Clostridium beijerinckii]
MNGNVELLNYIHQNSEMGTNTIKQLVDISKDEEYKKCYSLNSKSIK